MAMGKETSHPRLHHALPLPIPRAKGRRKGVKKEERAWRCVRDYSCVGDYSSAIVLAPANLARHALQVPLAGGAAFLRGPPVLERVSYVSLPIARGAATLESPPRVTPANTWSWRLVVSSGGYSCGLLGEREETLRIPRVTPASHSREYLELRPEVSSGAYPRRLFDERGETVHVSRVSRLACLSGNPSESLPRVVPEVRALQCLPKKQSKE